MEERALRVWRSRSALPFFSLATLRTPVKIIVLTAPSGAGKTTIARYLMERVERLRFSVSATTRAPRENEVHGRDYFFLDGEEFDRLVAEDAFIEHEEVYEGRCYGTLRSELEKTAREGAALLDIDVKGAINVKRMYGDQALTIFIQPPSLAALAQRLHARGTESDERIAARLERAKMELEYVHEYDAVVVNDALDEAVAETVALVESFLRAAPSAAA